MWVYVELFSRQLLLRDVLCVCCGYYSARGVLRERETVASRCYGREWLGSMPGEEGGSSYDRHNTRRHILHRRPVDVFLQPLLKISCCRAQLARKNTTQGTNNDTAVCFSVAGANNIDFHQWHCCDLEIAFHLLHWKI